MTVIDYLAIDQAHVVGYSYGGGRLLRARQARPEPGGLLADWQHAWRETSFAPFQHVDETKKNAEAVLRHLKQKSGASFHQKPSLDRPERPPSDRSGSSGPPVIRGRAAADDDALFCSSWAKLVPPWYPLVRRPNHVPNATFVSFPGLGHGQVYKRADLVLPHVTRILYVQ